MATFHTHGLTGSAWPLSSGAVMRARHDRAAAAVRFQPRRNRFRRTLALLLCSVTECAGGGGPSAHMGELSSAMSRSLIVGLRAAASELAGTGLLVPANTSVSKHRRPRRA